jgi:hypothetical protein
VERNKFLSLLADASERTVAITELRRSSRLSRNLRFRVALNRSHDDSADAEFERTYPQEGHALHERESVDAVADLLWRDERVPEWIDPCVLDHHLDWTLIGLQCCGRYAADEPWLYRHPPEGMLIFNVPTLEYVRSGLGRHKPSLRSRIRSRWSGILHIRARRRRRKFFWGR